MTREFVILKEFDKSWKSFGLNDNDLRELENFLCINPDYGAIIEGTGGLRKLRWKIPGSGKSGGIRAIYIDFVFYDKIYLITAYKKNVQENLTQSQKSELKQLVKYLENELNREKKQ